MTTLHIGQHWIKQTSHRPAQVTALTPTHAVMYWPDINDQTTVKRDRFRRAREWQEFKRQYAGEPRWSYKP